MKVVQVVLFSGVLLFFSLLISGCGEEAFNGGCNPADTATVISTLAVEGSRTDGATEVIDGSRDFTVSWDLTSSCTYTYSLYLAADVTQTNLDVELVSGTCGFGYSCNTSVDVDCSFDPASKELSCGSGDAVDVASQLPDPGPSNRYFILEASNELLDSATRVSPQVRLDY